MLIICLYVVIRAGVSLIEDSDEEQSRLFKELTDMNKEGKSIEEKYFMKNIRFLLDAWEKVQK